MSDLGSVDHGSLRELLETSIQCPSARQPGSKEEQKDDMVNYFKFYWICFFFLHKRSPILQIRKSSIAISTVMILARHNYDDITAEHVKQTEEYFRTLRRADGYPENVRQLMKILSNLKKSGKILTTIYSDDEDYDEDEKYDRMAISDFMWWKYLKNNYL